MIADGVMIETACRTAGISARTYRRWLANADDPNADPKYAKFRDDADAARAKAEADSIQMVAGHAKDDWRAAAWFLERSFPAKYGRQTRTEVTGKDDTPLTMMPLTELHAIAAAHDAGMTPVLDEKRRRALRNLTSLAGIEGDDVVAEVADPHGDEASA